MSNLTIRQKILVAAHSLAANHDPIELEHLIVRAWRLYPETFSMKGYTAYPDTNKVQSKICGYDGVLKLGWLEAVDGSGTPRAYRVTRAGRLLARQLASTGTAKPAVPAPRPAPPPSTKTDTRPVAPRPAPAAPRPAPAALAMPAMPATPATPATPAASDTGGLLVPAKPAGVGVGSLFAQAVVAAAEMRSPLLLTKHELFELFRLARSRAVSAFTRAQKITFADAKDFWGIGPSDTPSMIMEKLYATSELATKAVHHHCDGKIPHPSLPPVSVCYGVKNLDAFMFGHFARELGFLGVNERPVAPAEEKNG